MKWFLIVLLSIPTAALGEWAASEKENMINGCVRDHVSAGLHHEAASMACQCMADEAEKVMTIQEVEISATLIQMGDAEEIAFMATLATPCYQLLQE